MGEELTNRQLASLIHISNVLNTSFDINTIIESILRETIEAVDAAEGGSFWLFDHHEGVLVAQSAQGIFYPKIFRQIRLKPGESMTGKTFLAGKSIRYPNSLTIKKALNSLSSQNLDLLMKSIPGDFTFSSVISSPILLKGESIGVLTLDSFQQSLNFTQADINLLVAICHQAAVAIERSILYKEKEETVKKLSYSIEAHRRLANLVLQGEDLQSILQHIRQWIGQNTFLFDDLGELISASYDQSLTVGFLHTVKQQANLVTGSLKSFPSVSTIEIENVNYQMVILSLGSKHHFLGLLIILSTNKMSDVDIAALEHACTVLSLELVKEQAVFDTQQRLKGEILTGLYKGQLDDAMLKKAKSFGFHSNHSYVAVIIHLNSYSEDQHRDSFMRKTIQIVNQAFMEQHTKGMTVRHQNQIVVLLSYQPNASSSSITSQIKVRAEWAQKEISFRNWKAEVCFGIGRVKKGLQFAHQSLQEAEKCIAFIQKFNNETKIISYSELGIQRFILQNSEEEVYEFVEEVLGPLIEYERTRKGELLKTLFAYFDSNQNVKKTAEALHVHINTLNYRLNRIEEILHIEWAASHQLLNIHLAINLFEYIKKIPISEE